MNISFCSLASQTDFDFLSGLSSFNRLPSFDKINTFWKYESKKPTQRVSITSVSEMRAALKSPTVENTTSANVPTSFTMSKSKKEKCALPEDYKPSDHTVICGRSQKCYNSAGNRRFRLLVKMRLNEYMQAEGKPEKSEVVSAVLDAIQEACPVGSFVTYENGRWYEVSERMKREKIGGLFRDLLHTKYKSSAKAKQAKKAAKESILECTFQQQNNQPFVGSRPSMIPFGRAQNQSPPMIQYSQSGNHNSSMLQFNEASSMLPYGIESPSMQAFSHTGNNPMMQYMGQPEQSYNNIPFSGQCSNPFESIPM